MKVLYCNPSFWEYRLPFYVELNRLFRGSFHVMYSTKRFLSGHVKLLDRIVEEMGENAHPYDDEPMFDVRSHSFHQFTEGGKQLPIPLRLWRRISDVKPDVLITEGFFQWTPLVQLWAFFHRVPVFMGYERTMWTERNNSKLKTWIRKIQDNLIAGYLVNGSETKKYLMSIGVKEEKIFVGGMSADGEGLRKGIASMTKAEKNTLSMKYKKKDGLMFLFCGALIERKGVEPLLSAWMKHHETHLDDTLVLVGGGELYDRIIGKYGNEDSVFIEGRVEYDKVYQYYGIADVFILPTIEDNWSLVIPEAMSCGLPVATSVYNGCHPELIHEGENGCTFDTFNQESILKALDYFHHVDLKEHGKKSIELEKNFNTENSAKREYDGIMAVLRRMGKV